MTVEIRSKGQGGFLRFERERAIVHHAWRTAPALPDGSAKD
jgi:hypothetical protein